MTLKEIEEDALHLSAHERAELAQKLLMSLDAPKMEEMAEYWLVVASRRADEKSGLTRVETIKKMPPIINTTPSTRRWNQLFVLSPTLRFSVRDLPVLAKKS